MLERKELDAVTWLGCDKQGSEMASDRVPFVCCQANLSSPFLTQLSPYRINPQVSHPCLTLPCLLVFLLSSLPFEWWNVNATSVYPTPEGSAGGPSTAVALQRTKIKNKPRLPSSLLKKVSNFYPMLVVPYLLLSPAFPRPHPPLNNHHTIRPLAPTPYPRAPPPLLPDPQPLSFPDGLLQTY